MSHFTVVIFGPDHEAQLAKYDENLRVLPYPVDVPLKDVVRALEYYKDKGPKGKERLKHTIHPDEMVMIVAEDRIIQPDPMSVARIYRWYTEEELFTDGDRYYRHSTYNPNSMWDWYSIGGRWRGYFPLVANPVRPWSLGDPGVFEKLNGVVEEQYRGCADVVHRGDVDLEKLFEVRQEDMDRFERFLAVYDSHQPFDTWDNFRTRVEAKELTIDEARIQYRQQSIIKALNSIEEFGPFVTVEDYTKHGRDAFAYATERMARRSTPFAYVVDGEWHQPGKMGWWGFNDATDETYRAHTEKYRALLIGSPESTLLTMVDCHI